MDAMGFLRSNHGEGGATAAAGAAEICIAAEFVRASNECISSRALGIASSICYLFPTRTSSRLVVMTEAPLQLRSKSTLQTSGCIFKWRATRLFETIRLHSVLISLLFCFMRLRWDFFSDFNWILIKRDQSLSHLRPSFPKTLSSRHLFHQEKPPGLSFSKVSKIGSL